MLMANWPSVIKHPENFPIWELFISFNIEFELRIISKKALREYWEEHSDCQQQLISWVKQELLTGNCQKRIEESIRLQVS